MTIYVYKYGFHITEHKNPLPFIQYVVCAPKNRYTQIYKAAALV